MPPEGLALSGKKLLLRSSYPAVQSPGVLPSPQPEYAFVSIPSPAKPQEESIHGSQPSLYGGDLAALTLKPPCMLLHCSLY